MTPATTLRRTVGALVLAQLAVLLSCQQPQRREVAVESRADTNHLAAIAADFVSWGPVDSHVRRAPTDCRAPVAVGARLSAASGADGHCEKLYRLYARDPAAYLAVESGASQVGQVLVKQSFELVPFAMPGPGRVPDHVVQLPDGSLATLGAPTGLFVMEHDGTDCGEASWTFATLAPDGTVTGEGRIASCISCHRAAPHGGLFGLDTSARVFAR
jgi:hypothetical protein